MQKLIILKTRPENLSQVVEIQKHALEVQLDARPGDLLLLAETQTRGAAKIRYGMSFKGQRRASPGESEAIWNRPWKFIIEGEGCRELDRPFVAQQEKRTSKNYGSGGPFVYVDAEDAEEFGRKGLLAPFIQPSQ